MFEQDYNNLYEAEKEEFRRVVNYLLSKTFIVRDVYDKQAKKMITSSEFLFMEKYYDIFDNYLSIAGWKLVKEPIDEAKILINSLNLSVLCILYLFMMSLI